MRRFGRVANRIWLVNCTRSPCAKSGFARLRTTPRNSCGISSKRRGADLKRSRSGERFEAHLREQFERTLPERLEKIVEDAEEKLREQFEENLPDGAPDFLRLRVLDRIVSVLRPA